MKIIFRTLTAFIAAALLALCLTSCNKEIRGDIVYIYGVTSFEGSTTGEIDILNKSFMEAFKTYLNADVSEEYVIIKDVTYKDGEYEGWDATVTSVCDITKAELESTGFQNKICFDVRNNNSNKIIWRWKINME